MRLFITAAVIAASFAVASVASATDGNNGGGNGGCGVGQQTNGCGTGGTGGAGGAGGQGGAGGIGQGGNGFGGAGGNGYGGNAVGNKQHQGQNQNQGQAQGQNQSSRNSNRSSNQNANTSLAGGGSASNNGNSYSSNYSEPLQAPSVSAPAVIGGNACAVGASLGLSMPGFGVSGGYMTESKNCELRQRSALLFNMGYKEAAKELMCSVKETYDAFKTAGIPCAPRPDFEGRSSVAMATPVAPAPAPVAKPSFDAKAYASVTDCLNAASGAGVPLAACSIK